MRVYFFMRKIIRFLCCLVLGLTILNPIEVKAEENVKAKSMKVFIDSHPQLSGIRLSMKDYIKQSWIENIPLYAFPSYLNERSLM